VDSVIEPFQFIGLASPPLPKIKIKYAEAASAGGLFRHGSDVGSGPKDVTG
jgi:hypothetical protein